MNLRLDRQSIETIIHEQLCGSANNIVTEISCTSRLDIGTMIYADPLVCIGNADDPMWEALKSEQTIGPIFRTPKEWLPEARSVISIFAPFSDHVLQSNAEEVTYPGSAWKTAYRDGGALVKNVSRFLADYLNEAGFHTIAPACSPEFRRVMEIDSKLSPGGYFASNWSERHAGYVCGHGTFGLSRGLITRRGIAGRFSSVVTALELQCDERPYEGLYDYCIMCGRCSRNCPVQAISLTEGKKHAPCSAWIDKMKELNGFGVGCGKCQVDVPCMRGIPASTYSHLTIR